MVRDLAAQGRFAIFATREAYVRERAVPLS